MHVILLIAICNDHQMENGDINYDPDTMPRTDGATAVYSCMSGYQLSGVTQRICVDIRSGMGGEWTGSMPSCKGMAISMDSLYCKLTFPMMQQSVIVSPSPME